MRIGKRFKRFMALLLGGLLAFNSLTVYADGDLNGTGQGQENQGGAFSYSGSYHIYHVNQGIRAYIMNKDGTVVSNVVDFVRYRPQDFAAGSGFSAEQFDYMVKTYQNKIGRWNKNKNADLNTDKSFGGKQTIVYLGGGKKDVSYVVTYDNLMNPQTGVQHPVRKSYDRNDPDFYTTSLVSAKMYTYAEVEGYLKKHIELRYGADSSPIDPAGGTVIVDTLTKQGVTISKKFKDPLNFEGWGSGLVASGEELKDQMTTVFKQDGAIMLQLLSMMAMPKTDGKGDVIGGLEPLFTFYDKSLNDKVAALKASGSENPLFDLFEQEKLYLAFEPIHWASFEVMKPNAKVGYNGNREQSFYSTPYIMYGTPSQIMWQCAKMLREYVAVNTGFFGMEEPPKYDNESLPEFLNWLEKEGFYCNWEWGLSDRIYMLDKDEPSLGLVKHSNIVDDMTPSYWRQLVDGYYGTGYGIMLFSLNPETGTSTFDEINYSSSSPNGYRPEKSEDKSNEGGLEAQNNIVKFYSTKENDNYVYECNFTRQNTIGNIVIEDEPDGGYKVDSWYTSDIFKEPVNDTDSYDEWKSAMENKQEGSKNGSVTLNPKETLYVRLVKSETEPVENPEQNPTNLVLHENELSHQFGLSDANNGVLVQGVVNYSSVSSGESCDEDVGDDDDYEACGSDYEWVDSEAWHFSLSNHKVYDPKFVWDWKQTGATSWGADDLGESGGDRKTGSNEPDGRMVLQRSFSDRPVLYPNMNQNTESTLINMGLNAPSYIPKADRYGNKPEQPSRVSWTGTFETDWVFDSNSPLATFEPSCGHGGSDTDTHNTSNNKSELDGAYSKPNNTTIYGLWGKENKGVAPLTDTAQQNIWKLGNLNFKGFKNHVKEQSFSFYPYYKMKFVSELDGSEQDAYLTAENLSTLFSLQRIDSSIFRTKGSVTLDLTSSQWSTHSKAHSLLAEKQIEDKNSLLPAGAIYDLKTADADGKASQSWVGYRIFNSYIPDKAVLKDATGVKNKDEVLQAIEAFKSSTKNILDNYEVVMHGQIGFNTEGDKKFYDGSIQLTGKTGKYKMGQNEFIRDSKYDLQTGSTSANSSDIDVLEEKIETYDWVLTSDADGNVTIFRDGTALETLNKTQRTLTNPEVTEFNSRTNMVTNFLSSIDRNLGSDRNGSTWYNEGFSIGCIEVRLAYRMGFGDGADSIRSTALNIKANGLLADRTDMFSLEEEKGRSYQFFTSNKSLSAEANGKPKFWTGSYDGIDIFVPNMNSLLVSKRFYASNTTVMDLN